MSEIHHFKNFSIVKGNVKIDVSLDRFSEQFQRAQKKLDSAVMTSMVPYMPFRNGTLIQNTKARSKAWEGTGKVCAAAPPYGRYQYMGKVRVDPVTNSPWAREGAKKVLTNRPLRYSRASATPEWFETAKRVDGEKWVDMVKKEAGGGKK